MRMYANVTNSGFSDASTPSCSVYKLASKQKKSTVPSVKMKAAIQNKPAFPLRQVHNRQLSLALMVCCSRFIFLRWSSRLDFSFLGCRTLQVQGQRFFFFLMGALANIAFRQQVLEPWMKTFDFLHPTSHQFACEQEIVLFLQSWHFLRISCSAAIVSCNRLFSLISTMSCCILGTFKFAKSRFAERQAPTPKIGTELRWSSSHSFWHCITLSLSGILLACHPL